MNLLIWSTAALSAYLIGGVNPAIIHPEPAAFKHAEYAKSVQ